MSRRSQSTAVPTPDNAPASLWRIALFGPVRAVHASYGATAFRTQRAKSMLALLVDANGEPLSRLHIAEQLWRDSGSGLVNLASELFYLRKRFERPGLPFFVAEDRTLRIPPDRYTSDVAEFEAALAAARVADDVNGRVEAFERAVAQYVAPFSQDVYDDWTDYRRDALADAYLAALVQLAEALLAAGRPDDAIGHARRAQTLDAVDSRAAIALLRAYGDSGAYGRARIAAADIEANFAAERLEIPPDLRQRIAAVRSGPSPDPVPKYVLPEPGAPPLRPPSSTPASPEPPESAPSPIPPASPAPLSPPPPSLPSGTLTFLIADEAPDERRVARSPVRGEVSLPKSEQARRNAAPEDPAEAEEERRNARQLAWKLFERRVREAAGRIVAPREDGAGAAGNARRIAVFAGALDAVEAAAATLEALTSQPPDKRDKETAPQLRMALLTIEASPTVESTATPSRADRVDEGVADVDAFPYDAAIADHLARLLGPAWGWQVLCSNVTAAMVLPEQQLTFNTHRRLARLGLVHLPGDAAPQPLHMLRYGGSEGYRYPPPDGLITASGAAALATSTSFVGRAADLEVLEAWIADPATRLITLKGLGGIGKTRLALEVAEAQRDRMAVWSVSLVDLRDGALIAGEVVKALGETVPAGETAEEVIVRVLLQRTSLLVLDNLEHLLAPAVAFIESLLAGNRLPSLTILATSRDVLKHSAERVFDVLPLPVPDSRPRPLPVLPPPADAPPDDPLRSNDSVRLFADRATVKRAAFALTDDVAPDVARLVTLLEGIPLAIELAAAKIAVLSPAQMADQIASHVRGGRYGLLKGAPRDVADRHQSLQAAMDWSWALLTPEQQRFLASLSVFRGGMTLEAAEYVTEDAEALDHLLALVDASLLQRVDVEGEREPRFGMLETVREYGERSSHDTKPSLKHRAEDMRDVGVLKDSIHPRFAEYFTSLALEAVPELLGGPTQLLWLNVLDCEHFNLCRVLDMGCEANDLESATRLASALQRFWLHRNYLQLAHYYLTRLITTAKAGSFISRPELLNLQWAYGNISWRLSGPEIARTTFLECLEMSQELSDSQLVKIFLHNVGSIDLGLGHVDDAIERLEICTRLDSGLASPTRAVNTLNNLAIAYWMHLDGTAALKVIHLAREICDDLDLTMHGAVISHTEANVLIDNLDYRLAAQRLHQCLEVLATDVDRDLYVDLLLTWSTLYQNLGDRDKAISSAHTALRAAQDGCAPRKQYEAYVGLASAYITNSSFEKARVAIAEVLAEHEKAGPSCVDMARTLLLICDDSDVDSSHFTHAVRFASSLIGDGNYRDAVLVLDVLANVLDRAGKRRSAETLADLIYDLILSSESSYKRLHLLRAIELDTVPRMPHVSQERTCHRVTVVQKIRLTLSQMETLDQIQ